MLFWKKKKKLKNISINNQELLNLPIEEYPISRDLKENREKIEAIVGNSNDILLKQFEVYSSEEETIEILTLGIDGLFNENELHTSIVRPLTENQVGFHNKDIKDIQNIIEVKDVKQTDSLSEGILSAMKGSIFLMVQDMEQGLIIHIEAHESRAIEEPPSESVVRGSREGFTETMSTNMAQLRRRISHPALRFKSFEIGEISQTKVILAYVDGIVLPEMVQKARDRLEQIKIDDLYSSGILEQLIEEHRYSIFPTIGNTERPDKAGILLMQGRIVLLVNGDPVALYAPNFFIEAFQATEDYSSRPYYASFIRLLRFIGFIISVTLPSLFIAAIDFHKEMIPSELIVSMTQAREKVPFPLWLEVLLMIIMFEIVREAGVRLPRPIGQAVFLEYMGYS